MISGTASTGALRRTMEFLAEGPFKLIVAKLPDGSVMVTVANTITGERHSITMSRHAAHVAANTLRFAARSLR